MGVGRQTLPADFLAEIVHLPFGEAPLQVGARVDSWRRVALNVDQITQMLVRRAAPEVS